jgi:CheY-like chemotaxis protein
MKPIRVLLIEDNEGDILLFKEALDQRDNPCALEVLRNGMLAIEWLESKASLSPQDLPQLIFLDINLPKKNGQEVLSFIKNDPRISHIPVIMLTTSSYPKDVITSYQNRANCYITKPVDADEFLKTINRIEDFWLHLACLPE